MELLLVLVVEVEQEEVVFIGDMMILMMMMRRRRNEFLDNWFVSPSRRPRNYVERFNRYGDDGFDDNDRRRGGGEGYYSPTRRSLSSSRQRQMRQMNQYDDNDDYTYSRRSNVGRDRRERRYSYNNYENDDDYDDIYVDNNYYNRNSDYNDSFRPFEFPYERLEQAERGGDSTSTFLSNYLYKYYPYMYHLCSIDDDNIWREINQDGSYFTLFIPTQEAFESLGKNRLERLYNTREQNQDRAQRIFDYHIVPDEIITPQDLYESSALECLGGRVPVQRVRRGGVVLFGNRLGGMDDGSVRLGRGRRVLKSRRYGGDGIGTISKSEGTGQLGAQIIRTERVGNGIIYEVDQFLNPEILFILISIDCCLNDVYAV